MKKSKKKKQRDDSMSIICIGILFLLFMVLFFFFRANIFKDEKYKEELKNKIAEKEQRIACLISELNKMNLLHDVFRNEAIRFFKTLKIAVIVIILVVGFICVTIFSFSFWGSITAIVMVSGIIYRAVTIVMQNKIGDFNVTLLMVQNYFIERTFRKNAFEPALIGVLEEQLNNEQKELEFLKVEYIRVSGSNA